MRKAVTTFLVLMMAVATGADLNPSPGTQPTSLIFRNADVVCSAVVTSVVPLNQNANPPGSADTERRTLRVTVKVQDYYKFNGEKRPVLELLYDHSPSREPPTSSPFQSGQFVLLFLKENIGGSYTLADPYVGLTAFASIKQVRGVSDGRGLDKLQTMLSAALVTHNREDILSSIRLIEGLDSIDSDTSSRIEGLSHSQDPEIVLAAFAVLIKTRMPESLSRLSDYLDSHDKVDQFISLLSVGSELAQLLDSNHLKEIEHLSSSKYLSIQLGAMNALRKMKNMASVPSLLDRLDDPNHAVQYIALITLAEIFGKFDDYAPSMYLFDQNPEHYTNLWKKWWREQGHDRAKP